MRNLVNETLKETGLPVAHMAFGKDNAPSLPFLVYVQGQFQGMYADNAVWHNGAEFSVELYQYPTSEEVEKKVEKALSKLGTWTRDEELWVESEGCVETVYHFTLYEKETNNGKS